MSITILQLVTPTAVWKEILFVAQVVFVEIFLMLSFQVLSVDLDKRILELKRLCNLTHAANMRLIKDVVSLKGLMRKTQETHPESRFANTSRVVMEALTRPIPARSCGAGVKDCRVKELDLISFYSILFYFLVVFLLSNSFIH